MPCDASPVSPPNDPIRLVFYTRPNCPLCERLALLVEPHLRGLARRRGVSWIECDITADADWLARYGERVPVLTRDGDVVLEGRPHEDEVAAAIARLTRP